MVPGTRFPWRSRPTKARVAVLLAALSFGACTDRTHPTAPQAPNLDLQAGDSLVTFSGTLRDRDGVPVPDSVWVILNRDTIWLAWVAAGDGIFSVTAPPDTYSLSLSGTAGPPGVLPSAFYLHGPSLQLTGDRVQDLAFPNSFLVVRVLGPDSQPLPNAFVTADGVPVFQAFPDGWMWGEQHAYAMSDSSGTAHLALLADTSVTLTINPPDSSGLAPRVLAGMVIDSDRTIQVVLAPPTGPVTLSGTLRDRDGVIIPDTVQVCFIDMGACGVAAFSGQFSITAPPGVHTLAIAQPADSFSTTVVPGSFFLSGATVEVTADSMQDLTLRNVALSVIVLGPDSQPVSNMLVTAWGTPALEAFPGGWIYGSQRTTRYSDSTGAARLPLFSDTAVTLVVTPSVESGLAEVIISGLVVDTDRTVQVVLQAVTPPELVTWSGTLRDRDSVPVSDLVLLRLFGNGQSYEGTAQGDGAYSLTVPTGSYHLSLEAANAGYPSQALPEFFQLAGISVDLIADRVQDLVLPNLYLAVTVVDADGQPLPHAAVIVNGPTALPIAGGWMSGYQSSNGLTDSSGIARVPLLPDSSATVIVCWTHCGELQVSVTGLHLVGDTAIQVVLQPPPEVTFSGVLRDRDGAPVPDSVEVFLLGNAGYGNLAWGDGAFSRSVPAGSYTLALERAAWTSPATTAVPSSFYLSGPTLNLTADRAQDLTLPNVSLQVTVLGPDGSPLPNAAITASGQPVFEAFPGGWFFGWQYGLAATGAGGMARLALFADTSLTLTVHAPDGSGLRDTTLGYLQLVADTGLVVVLGGGLRVTIDVKPGSDPNTINLASAQVPVAVLSSPVFDAGTINAATVVFSGGHSARNGVSDVNGDGLLDAVFHFPTDALNLPRGPSQACLTGETLAGREVRGCDTVRVIGR